MRTETHEIARDTFATVKGATAPAWAEAMIVAQFETDQSDSMSDYYATRTERTIVIGWSKHKRDLFPEMRKAAATFPPTAHLGPGCDVWSVSVEHTADVIDGGRAYWKGSISHWHGEILGVDSSVHGRQFLTESDARAWIAEQPTTEPHPIHFGDVVGTFGWRVSKSSVEHREKYSMGSGYYLKASGAYSTGWTVSKQYVPTSRDCSDFDVYDPSAPAPAAPVVEPAPEPSARVLQFAAPEIARAPVFVPAGFTIERAPAPVEPERPRVEYNGERDGLEVHFPAKPSADVLTALKADGWRWSRFSGCWYRKASENARQSLQTILNITIDPGIIAASRAFAAGSKVED